ncbi:MAG TPA: gephyrin-like molybdotransferase Glp [Anaerovoracaceae bacterium]|nr:gephyrin-like molybdotransferase Glp [Anaerovoracaceae bacterium]
MKLLKVDTVKEVKDKLKIYFDDKGFESPTETVSLRDAVHRYLTEEICSDTDIPQFTRSVVDGYAVVAKDTFGTGESSPVFLDAVGAVEMGKACNIKLEPGQAVYIPTGGMLPAGSDAVVMIEYVESLDEKTIAVYKSAAPNSGIMNQGDDFKKGQVLFRLGHRITVKDVGMLAAIGKDQISVFKKPRVSILSTGDEIIDITQIPKPGEVRDINSYTIAAFAEETGAMVQFIEKVPDVGHQLRSALEAALAESDIVLLSGGSSAGNKDLTAETIDSMGKPGVVTHGIAMKPGKPTIIGIIETESMRNKLVVGLPGHPMAAIVAYDVIVNDFMRKYCFHNEEEPIRLTARITENIHAGEGRETYQLVSVKRMDSENKNGKDSEPEWIAEPIHAKSGSISQLMMADGYVKISSLSEGVKVNSSVEVTLIGR